MERPRGAPCRPRSGWESRSHDPVSDPLSGERAMRFRSCIVMAASAVLTLATPGGLGAIAQSPSASPELVAASCPPMTEARSPLVEPGSLETQSFGAQNAAVPNPDPAYTGRFHP